MLETILIILVVLWALGLFAFHAGGLIHFLLVIALVIRNTLRIPNVQSATGFFYIAILTVLLGEVLGRALLLYTGIPF